MPGIKAAPPPAELPDLPELPTSPRTARAGSRNVFSFRPIANRFQKPRISEDELTGVKPNSFRSDMRSTTLAHIGSHRSIVATYSDISWHPLFQPWTLYLRHSGLCLFRLRCLVEKSGMRKHAKTLRTHRAEENDMWFRWCINIYMIYHLRSAILSWNRWWKQETIAYFRTS